VKFSRVVPEIYSATDTQTDMLIAVFCTAPGGEVITKNVDVVVDW